MRITGLIAALSLCLPTHVLADGPTTYEAAGMLDAYIKMCSEAEPDKAQYYRQLVLTSFSCGKPLPDMERNLAEIRESKRADVRKAYQDYLDKVNQEFQRATEKQKSEFCKGLSETRC